MTTLPLIMLSSLVSCSKVNTNEWLPSKKDPPINGPINDNTVNKLTGFWYELDSRELTDAQINMEAPRRKVVVLQAWKHNYIAKFKAANPDIKVLVYKNLSASINSYEVDPTTGDTLYSTGVSYAYADTYHPEWFMMDDNDQRIVFSNYTYLYQMDIGNTDYQQYWADHVTAELEKYGWDGVFIDDILFLPDESHSSFLPKNYKTAESFQKAYRAILGMIQSRLKASGKISIGNLSGAYRSPGAWSTYLEYMDGALDEWWITYGTDDYVGGDIWKLKLAEVAYTESQGKIALVMPHSSDTDPQGFYYALASFWLTNNGHTYFTEQKVKDDYYLPSPWRDEYGWNMGKALGAYDSVGTNFKYYRRDFTRVVVMVNPQTANISINLDQTYLNEAGQRVTAIVLPPKTGTILRRIFQ